MLELIVLGQVPGTNLVITFNWVIIIAVTFFICLQIYFLNLRQKFIPKLLNNKKVAN